MENYNGIAISKNDKEFVVAFDNFVNGKMQSATNTGKALATIHRYLQSQAFKVCVAYIRQLSLICGSIPKGRIQLWGYRFGRKGAAFGGLSASIPSRTSLKRVLNEITPSPTSVATSTNCW